MEKKIIKLTAIVSLLFFLSMIVGCTNKQPGMENSENNSEVTQESEGSSFPISLTDANGEEVTIEKKPTRIVSLMPSNTEIIFALGAGDLVVGVTDWDNYPEEVLEIAKVGGLDFNVESVIGLEPDLVVASASGMSNQEGFKQLENVGIPVLIVHDAKSFSEVYHSIELIGKVVGAEGKATEMINTMKQEVENIKQKASVIKAEDRKTVWVEVETQPNLYTTGKGTFIDEMLTLIHAKNAAGEYEGWVPFTEEEAILLNPDVIVVTYGFYVENPIEQVFSREAWKDVPAVKNKQVFAVDADKVNRSGPRLIEGVEELAAVVYPEIFTK